VGGNSVGGISEGGTTLGETALGWSTVGVFPDPHATVRNSTNNVPINTLCNFILSLL
jgi:hypothetical protein